MKKLIRLRGLVLVFIFAIAIVTLPAVNVSALKYGVGKYGTCTYNTCGITLSSINNLSVDVAPISNGSCSINKDVISVTTGSSTGYTVTLTTNSGSNSLSNGSSNITAGSGTFSLPQTLGVNQWGYRVDGSGSFGSGPTTVKTNSNFPITDIFSGVPASTGTPSTVVNSSLPANPTVNTNVWYGVCADTNLSSGQYTGTVVYTAVIN